MHCRRKRASNPREDRASRVAEALARHSDRTRYAGGDDLVFCHPHTGRPYDPDTMSARFRSTLDRAACDRSRCTRPATRSRLRSRPQAFHCEASWSSWGTLTSLRRMIYAHLYSDGHDLIERAFVARGIE